MGREEDSSREGPPRTSGTEEACDKRSWPQDVTSSGLDTEGSICSKRSRLTRSKDLLATSSVAYHHRGLEWWKCTYRQTAAAILVRRARFRSGMRLWRPIFNLP